MAYGMMNNYGAGYMNPYYAPVSQPLQRPVMQDQPAPSPFQDVRFVNEKQAEAFITLAGQRVLLIDIENRKMWIKYADGMGITTTETYRFEKVEGAEKTVDTQPAIDLSNYVVKDDLKNVATKDEIGALRETIADLQKRVKISQILAEKPMSTAKGE